MSPNNLMNNSDSITRYLVIDYLRGFLTVLVVLHHVLIGYTSHGIGAVIIDSNRFPLFDLVTGLLDLFFMFLFFFISGLFVLKSIQKKGALKYLRHRFLRLGVPFLIGWLFINTPAYYLHFLTTVNHSTDMTKGLGDFLKYWMEVLHLSTSGHLWFLWVLLLFNCMTVIIFKIKPNIIKGFENSSSRFFSETWYFLLGFFLLGIVCYVPLTIFTWKLFFVQLFGPFILQLDRVILYFMFYFVGAAVGVYGMDRSIFKPDGILVKRCWLVFMAAMLSYFTIVILYIGSIMKIWVFSILAVSISMLLSFSLLTIFIRYVKQPNRIFDNLRKNAYGIYIFHYCIVSIWQFVFLDIDISGAIKAVLVFILALFTTWGLVSSLRKIPLVSRIIG